MKMINILTITLLFFSYRTCGQSGNKITVKVINLQSNKGQVIASVFTDNNGFPNDSKKAAKTINVPIKANTVTIEFTNLSPGTYAVGIIHDENGNNIMDVAKYIFPKEGYAVSNNVTGTFGPSSFNDSKFKLESTDVSITLKIIYKKAP